MAGNHRDDPIIIEDDDNRDDPILIEDDNNRDYSILIQALEDSDRLRSALAFFQNRPHEYGEGSRLRSSQAFFDNMPYEELLAWEKILSKNIVTEVLRNCKYQSTLANDGNDSCCVCLETYGDGEELGKLDCGHKFHFECIKKWLEINITCPICKRTPLKP